MAEEEEKQHNIIEIEIPYPLFQYLGSQECNLQNICRICLSVNEQDLIPLYCDKEISVLANMFIAISEVQMCAEDGLPSNICQRCQTEMINYYEFKMKCVKSDYTLKSVLKGEFISKEESTLCNNNIEINGELETEIKPIEINPKTEVQEQENIGIDNLEDLKYSISDDEALCIVRNKKNDQKEITIINGNTKPNNLLQKMVVPQESKAKRNNNKISKKKTKHKCKFCFKKFNKIKLLKAHIRKLHSTAESESPYPCEQCKETFDSEFDLGIHGMLHNQDSDWKCTECQKLFKDKKSLRRHIMRHMNSKRYQCSMCGSRFVELYALRRHMRVHTGERPEKKHPCNMCDEKFVDVCRLREHMARHDMRSRSHVCSCGAGFPSARLLASHRRVHSADKPHACAHCGIRFRHESTRNTHERTHTGERPYVCAHCGKRFIQKSNLTLHMRTHTGEKPYSCSVCDRKFSSGSTLKAHKRTHTGERPFTCKVCGKSFACLNLKLHMRLHTGERPFACSACPKRFSTAPRLKEHNRLHTGERPYECAMCSKKFTTKSQLLGHVKRHEKKKKTGKKGKVMLTPVTVTAENLRPKNTPVLNKADEYIYGVPNVEPNSDNLCTVQETPLQPNQGLVFQDDDNMNTQVIVLGSDPSLVPSDVNLVTVNEGEMTISAASAMVDGTTVKLYQYDQSLLQIHTGSGQLIVRRVSSKMTTNF